jgi:transcriptional repressor NrdR
MVCPYCKKPNTKVVDKRDVEDEPVSRRRRECLSCRKRFTTYERVESIDLKVVKKDGSLQQYNREKLILGIGTCTKERLETERIEKIVDDIEFRLMNRKSTEVSTGDIGRMVLTRLKNEDTVSYLRFASVFLDFKDVEEFKNEISKLEKN